MGVGGVQGASGGLGSRGSGEVLSGLDSAVLPEGQGLFGASAGKGVVRLLTCTYSFTSPGSALHTHALTRTRTHTRHLGPTF